ncbi:hypothetical protein H5T87_03455 [bacterium]|nr:hypothetical protein [bacterium]
MARLTQILCLLSLFFNLAGAQEFILREDFESEKLSSLWQLHLGEKQSFARLEKRNGGKCFHLFGDHSQTNLTSAKAIANIDYTLEYDFFQPPDETGGYQAVVHHPRPEGHSYWWLEYGPERFFLYTLAGGNWFNRWQASGIPTNRWLHIQIRNTPKSVKVRIYDETGQHLLAESPAISHDDGDPAPLVFAAIGDQRGVWGMKIDNIRLYVTPIPQRDDYILRQNLMNIITSTLTNEETLRYWGEAGQVLQNLKIAFDKIGTVSLSDWQSYVEANKNYDILCQDLSMSYHKEVISKMEKERNGWIMLDLWKHLNASSLELGIPTPFTEPVSDVQGIPFITTPFGKNCIWQDLPSRSRISIPLNAKAKILALLIAPFYDEELYSHDDSLIDVLQIELSYENGFKERIFPQLIGWKPPLPYEIGNPPFPNKEVKDYIVQPSHPAPISHITLCDGAIQAGWAIFAISYQPGNPTPPFIGKITRKNLKIKPIPPKVSQTGEEIIIENTFYHLAIDKKKGIIRDLHSVLIGNPVSMKNPSPIFAIQLSDGELLYSDDFSLKNHSLAKAKDSIILNLTYQKEALEGIELQVRIKASMDGKMEWGMEIHNSSSSLQKVRPVFPLLDGLSLGKRLGWYFPQRGGAVSELPLEGLSSYGGMAWLQIIDAYIPEGGGIYLRSDDTQGIYKIFALRWSPNEETAPKRVADIPEPAHPLNPWRSKVGLHLSIQYLPWEIPPGGSWSSPPATICIHQGDWRDALSDYRKWLKGWWKQLRPCPTIYKYGFYALVGGAPADNQKGEEFGSYDWWHLSPFWTIDYPDELKEELMELKKQAERAKAWGQAVGVYIEGMVLEKKRKIAKEHGAEWAMMDDKGNYYDYYSTESNPVWNICPAVREWQEWDAKAYAEIARQVPLCAMYVDSTGSRWAEVCYNPLHHHKNPGIWVQGCGELFEAIRQAVMNVNPKIAIHSEEPGSDYMAMHEDGSWSHSLWTNLSGDIEYNPAGLNYFRFVLPQFKMYEIPSYRHGLWRCKLAFFNGEGLWTNQPDALRRELFIRWMPTLRENADIFLSEDVEPALPLLSPPLFINRFRKGEQMIYTIYNAGLRTQFAQLRLPLPRNGHIFDLLNLKDVNFHKKGEEAVIDIEVDPHNVLCYLVTPRLMRVEKKDGKLKVEFIGTSIKAKELLLTRIDEEEVRRDTKRFPLDQKVLFIDLEKHFPQWKGKILLRIALPHSTEDIATIER